MPTRIVLDEQQDRLIEELVRSGHFRNASEAIREDLRLVHGRETEGADQLEALRAEARLGIASLDQAR